MGFRQRDCLASGSHSGCTNTYLQANRKHCMMRNETSVETYERCLKQSCKQCFYLHAQCMSLMEVERHESES